VIDGEAFSVIAALTDVMRWLTDEAIPGTIVGGVAASILGRPRMTRDVDALILAEDTGWDRLVSSAAAEMPEIHEDFEGLLRRISRSSRPLHDL
jgi:hypothetical protein